MVICRCQLNVMKPHLHSLEHIKDLPKQLVLQGLCMGHKCLCFDKLKMSKRGEKIVMLQVAACMSQIW